MVEEDLVQLSPLAAALVVVTKIRIWGRNQRGVWVTEEIDVPDDGSVALSKESYSYLGMPEEHWKRHMSEDQDWTLAIIKPDAVGNGKMGAILARMETHLSVADMEYRTLFHDDMEVLYGDLKDKPFYPAHAAFMLSGPVLIVALTGPDAAKRWRSLMGATDPTNAEPGTIRAMYGSELPCNAVHGSDSKESAAKEVLHFFSVSVG